MLDIEKFGKGDNMINLNIDGIDVSVKEGTLLVDACKQVGIKIPTLCHDDSLKPFGGCRICVVEVEGFRNLVASCSTKVQEGMVVRTNTDTVINARKMVLDLLLSNHPVEDCLTCDKTGSCDLQNLAYEYDVRPSFHGARKDYEIEARNPVLIRDQSKCILCGKCVRVCKEVQVTTAIDFVGRGFESKIAAGFDLLLSDENCRLCGQCISVCPTGAIMNKQLVGVRPWEVKKVRTTCPFCGTGCNFDLNVHKGKVIGVTPAEDAVVNGKSLCVKGRSHTDLINSPNRLKKPLKKVDGEFVEISWDEAISTIAEKFTEIKDEFGPDAIAGLSSARTTNEDNYTFQKFMRVAIGTNNVDHCART